MSLALRTVFMGALMGFCLSRIGFTSWDEVHAMFTFHSLRMFLAFCGSVALLAVAWPLLSKLRPGLARMRPRVIHRGSIAGGVLFGMGWALSGACPSIGLAQIGEGQLAAGWTLLGMVAGNWLYAAVHVRFLRWDTGSCVDD